MILLQSKGYIKFVGRNTRYHHIPTTTLQELEKYSGYYPTNEEITKINTEIFNSRFEKYIGKNKNRDDVERLIESVNLNNLEDDENIVKVDFYKNTNMCNEEELNGIIFELSDEEKYIIKVDEKNEEGYISKIMILVE